MSTQQKVKFSSFLKIFPEVELPITLTDDLHHVFSKNNDPLPAAMIQTYLLENEEVEPDEFTEYIACFRFPKTEKFHAVLYWKAELLTYEYILVTYDEKGSQISKRVVAGTKAEGNMLERTVATIEEDWIIYCVRGVAPADENKAFDPSSSQSLSLEILATGEIILSD